MELDKQKIETLMKEKKYAELNEYMKNYVTIPTGLAGNPEETKRTIIALNVLLKLQVAMETGKYVKSDDKGIKSWIKTHFLGYITIENLTIER